MLPLLLLFLLQSPSLLQAKSVNPPSYGESSRYAVNFQTKCENMIDRLQDRQGHNTYPPDTSSCEGLAATTEGRHLLMLLLLEKFTEDSWVGRCASCGPNKIFFYLPDSLKNPAQPSPAPTYACLLPDVLIQYGQILTREAVQNWMETFGPMVTNKDGQDFSWYNNEDVATLNTMVDMVLEQEDVFSTLSLMFTMKQFTNRPFFSVLASSVIAGRSDTGFIFPSATSLMAEEFGGESEEVVWDSAGLSEAWWIREDPTMSDHHYHWHQQTRRDAAGTLRVLNPLVRRGEIFYYMHSQMQARYAIDRVGEGLGYPESWSPDRWDDPIPGEYKPLVKKRSTRTKGTVMGSKYALQVTPGDFMSDREYRRIQANISTGAYGGYENGVDHGICEIGEAVEFGIHNYGHGALSRVNPKYVGPFPYTPRYEAGVMGHARTAAREPVFYNWHGFINDIFWEYKLSLGRYGAEDLAFPGVEVRSAEMRTLGNGEEYYPRNTLYTSIAPDTIKLKNCFGDFIGTTDRQAELDCEDSLNPQPVSLTFSKLNHLPFSLSVEVFSFKRTLAVVRAFLVPINFPDPKMFIELDKWLVELNPGMNTLTRSDYEAPHLGQQEYTMYQLQQLLASGQLTPLQFAWGGCGWPQHLALPKQGHFHLVVMVSKILPGDSQDVEVWRKKLGYSWSYCGVQVGKVPDSRPMGFPMDREYGTLDDLVGYGGNFFKTEVDIIDNNPQPTPTPPTYQPQPALPPPPPSYPTTQPPRPKYPTIQLY